MAKTPAWTRKEGKAEAGGLNAKKEVILCQNVRDEGQEYQRQDGQ